MTASGLGAASNVQQLPSLHHEMRGGNNAPGQPLRNSSKLVIAAASPTHDQTRRVVLRRLEHEGPGHQQRPLRRNSENEKGPGLEREKGQKPSTAHAWDLPHKSASLLYFNAGFHSDHHTKASVDPDQLAFKATRFVIPYNIPIILPMALVPPLFFRTMNPLLGE